MFQRTAAAITFGAIAASAPAQIHISMADNLDNQLPGLTFRDGDVVRTDSSGSSGSIVFNEDLFGGTSADVDAFHILPDGTFLLSTIFNGRTLGGLTFNDGDLVKYDPVSDTASIFEINETVLNGDDVDAITVLPDGNLAFSVTGSTVNIGGLTVQDGDILKYQVPDGTVSVLFPESQIFDDGDAELSALHSLADGRFAISSFADESVGGVNFRNGDLFIWDPITNSAELLLSEDVFLGANGYNINAAFIPAPAPLAVLAGLGLAAARRRR